MKNKFVLKNEFMSIDTKDKSSIVPLIHFLSESFTGQNILFISSQNSFKIKHEIENLEEISSYQEMINMQIKFFFLKNPLSQLIEKFGKEHFIKELKKIIEQTSAEIIYFDRFDLLFDLSDIDEIKEILDDIVNTVKHYNKRVVFIYDSKDLANMDFQYIFSELIYNNYAIDENNSMKEEDMTTCIDKIVKPEKEILNIHSEDNESVSLSSVMNMEVNIENKSKNMQMLLISDNKEMQMMHNYLFRGFDYIDFYSVNSLPEDSLYLLQDMDIIVYNLDDEDTKKSILEKIKENKLEAKLFHITNKQYVRQVDMNSVFEEGIDKVFKTSFSVENYLLSIEKYINNKFYTKRLEKVDFSGDNIIFNKTAFEKKIENLLKNKIFFSVIYYRYVSDINIENYHISKIIRDTDMIYINKENNEMMFLVLNIMPSFVSEQIEERISCFSISLSKKNSVSAFDLVS